MKPCQVGWKALNIEPSNQISPCCLISPMHGAPALNPWTDVDNFFEVDSWRTIQEQGANDAKCSYCLAQEMAGAFSVRKGLNKILSDAHQPTLEYLNLNISNICNFRCRTCDPSRSFLIDDSLNPKMPRQRLDFDSVLKIVHKWRHHLRFVSIQGGEPLIEPDLVPLMQSIRSISESCQIAIVTNLSVLPTSFVECIDSGLVSRVKFSIDGIEKSGEYIRHGLNWQQFHNNLKELRGHLPKHLIASVTVSSYSVFGLNSVFEYLQNYGDMPIDLNLCVHPEYCDIRNMRDSAKKYLLSKQFQKFDSIIKSRIILPALQNDETFISVTKAQDTRRKVHLKDSIPDLNQFYPEI